MAFFDSNNPIVTNTGQQRNTVGTGFDLGGGINLGHSISNGSISLSYQGAYRDYQSTYYASGATQSLNLALSKRLGRHVSLVVGVSGGTYLYGGTLFQGQTTDTTVALANPLSSETRYASAYVGVTLQQTRRLSYSLFGNFFLSRYNYSGGIGTTGVSGGASVNYRLTARDTVYGTYSHSYYNYQQNFGNTNVDQIGVGYTHTFSGRWIVSVYGGGARSVSNGFVTVPVTLLVGNEAVGGYVTGKFNQTAYIPSFSGSVSRSYRHSLLTASAGEGIAGSGNGYFLASRNIYLIGVYSYSLRNQNISFGGTAYRLSSISNTVSNSYSSAAFSANYSRMLFKYIGAFLRYDYNHYGALHPYAGIGDNRISFGFNFSSRSVPVTLF